MSEGLGNFLDRLRKGNIGVWKLGLFVFLGAALVVNFFIHPRHAEYFLDNYPGHWAVFGLVVAVAMILFMKKIVQPLLKRPEEKDDD
ncbi:MAG: hypothetical protein WBV21_07455 [Desulfobacterales bacterium]